VRGRALLAPALVALAVLVAVVAVAAVRHRTSGPVPLAPVTEGPPVPRTGAYLGAWVEPDPFSQPGRVATFERFEDALGRPLKIVHLYRRWGQPIGTASDRIFAARGKYLLLSWAIPDTVQVASGRLDGQIATAAREIAALPTQVFLEPRWEMDRPNLRSTMHSPADYIAAWRHIRAVFARVGVDNLAWTWCPTAHGFADGTAPNFYPGDAEVDWVCADVYPTRPWVADSYESFSSLASPFMTWASQHDKPVIIGEFAAPITYGAERARWIRDAGAYIEAHPRVKAALWFEQSDQHSAPDSRFALVGDPTALRAFAALGRDRWFRAGA
jgi:Glycosyl hydrolase family 26